MSESPELIYDTQDIGGRNHLRCSSPLLEDVGRLIGHLCQVGGVVRQEDPAEEGDGLGDEATQVYSLGHHLRNQLEGRLGVLFHHGVGEPHRSICLCQPNGPAHALDINGPAPEGGDLLEQAQGIARRSPGLAGDQPRSRGLEPVPLLAGHRRQVFGQDFGADCVEVEPLRPATDGVEQLVRLGGGEDEVDMARRLFQRLEQGVSRRLGEHVGLVEDEHPARPLAHCDGGDAHPYVADVVHRVVRGGVEFDHVE